MRSMNRELTAMAKRVRTSSRAPCFFTATVSKGTFMTSTVVPTGRAGRNRVKIWTTPVKPPMAMLFGWKKQLNAAA